MECAHGEHIGARLLIGAQGLSDLDPQIAIRHEFILNRLHSGYSRGDLLYLSYVRAPGHMAGQADLALIHLHMDMPNFDRSNRVMRPHLRPYAFQDAVIDNLSWMMKPSSPC